MRSPQKKKRIIIIQKDYFLMSFFFTDWVREIEVKRICHDQSNRRWSRAGRNKAVKCHIFLAVALLFS